MGAPKNLAFGSQTSVGLSHLKTAIRVLENHQFEFQHGNYTIRHEPIGVCGLITPWNWPINQIVSKLGPCLASGCTAILKPSEIAPLSANIIAEIIHEARAPAGVFNNQTKSFLKNYTKLIPVKKMASQKQIYSAIDFLLSEDANYVVGQNIYVDGGFTA